MAQGRRPPGRVEHLDLGEPGLRELGAPGADEPPLLLRRPVRPDLHQRWMGHPEGRGHLGDVGLAVAEEPLGIRGGLLAGEVEVAVGTGEPAAQGPVHPRAGGEVAAARAHEAHGGDGEERESDHHRPVAGPGRRGASPGGDGRGCADHRRGPGERSQAEEEEAPIEGEGLVVDRAGPDAEEGVEQVRGGTEPALEERRREGDRDARRVEEGGGERTPPAGEPGEHAQGRRGERGGEGDGGNEGEAERGAARREERGAQRRPSHQRRLEERRARRGPDEGTQGRRVRAFELAARPPDPQRGPGEDREERRDHPQFPPRGLEQREPGQPEPHRGEQARGGGEQRGMRPHGRALHRATM